MNYEQYIPYAMVAAGVLAVLLIIVLLFRAFAGRRDEGDAIRLAVTEYLEVDKQRRLVLVRRDNVEHLLLIGGNQDLVVETSIRPGTEGRMDMPASPRIRPGDRLDPDAEPAAVRPMPLRAAPRPAVFGDRPPPSTEPSLRAEPRLQTVTSEAKPDEA